MEQSALFYDFLILIFQSKIGILCTPPPSYSVADCRGLVKTLVCGVKTITWGAASCKAPGMGEESFRIVVKDRKVTQSSMGGCMIAIDIIPSSGKVCLVVMIDITRPGQNVFHLRNANFRHIQWLNPSPRNQNFIHILKGHVNFHVLHSKSHDCWWPGDAKTSLNFKEMNHSVSSSQMLPSSRISSSYQRRHKCLWDWWSMLSRLWTSTPSTSAPQDRLLSDQQRKWSVFIVNGACHL